MRSLSQEVKERRSLDVTRQSLTHKFAIGNHEGYLTVGLYDDGAPGEIFIKMSKEGSTMSGMVQAFCRALSIALQYGLPLEEAVPDAGERAEIEGRAVVVRKLRALPVEAAPVRPTGSGPWARTTSSAR